MLSIEQFYNLYNVDETFDEIEYLKNFPEATNFYQPHCKNHNISDKKRLYFHFRNYVEKMMSSHMVIYDSIKFMTNHLTNSDIKYCLKNILNNCKSIREPLVVNSHIERQTILEVAELLVSKNLFKEILHQQQEAKDELL